MNKFYILKTAFKNIYDEFIRIFWVQKKEHECVIFRFLLIGLFSLVYLPHAFILLDDINLISAYEVDPGSMISAINDLYHRHYYDMMNGYHSRYYGWSYFSINFFLLLPIKIFALLFGSSSDFLSVLLIKLTFFLIGLLAVLGLWIGLNKIGAGKRYLISFCVCLLFVFSSTSYLFYFIHPETTGALFIFAAIGCLIEYVKKAKNITFLLGLTFLVLASMSKQTFFIGSIFIFIGFIHFYRINISKTFLDFMRSKDFYKLARNTTLVSFSIAFIIHPYAFIDFLDFLSYQSELSKSFSSGAELSYVNSIVAWIDVLKFDSVMLFSFLTLPFVFIISLYKYKVEASQVSYLSLLNSFAAISTFLFVAYGNRLVFSHHYLFPAYLFLFINIFIIFDFLTSLPNNFLRRFFKVFAVYFFILFIAVCARNAILKSFARFDYQSSIAFHTYSFIKNNVKNDDKIAHDHFVAVPFEMNSISCHFWRGCGTDFIEKFNPNYVIYNPNYSFAWPSKETERLTKYVQDHNMILITKIEGNQANPVDADIKGSNLASVYVYKKP